MRPEQDFAWATAAKIERGGKNCSECPAGTYCPRRIVFPVPPAAVKSQRVGGVGPPPAQIPRRQGPLLVPTMGDSKLVRGWLLFARFAPRLLDRMS
jgi:hypothetical protein